MEVRQAGDFQIQVKVAGIVSQVVGDVKVERYVADTFTKVVIKKLYKFGSCAVITYMALGNSDWHDPMYSVPISFTLVGMLMWGTIEQFGYSSTTGAGYIIAYSLIVVFTLVGLLGWAKG